MDIPIKEGFKFLKGKIKEHPTTSISLEYITKRDAISILVFDENIEKVLLVEQYRPGCDKNTFESVAGVIDSGENPFDAVKRELKEETGYGFENLTNILSFNNEGVYTAPAFCNEKIYYYAATLKSNDIKPGDTNFDLGEDIKSHWIKIEDLKNYLLDSKTILSLYYFFPKLKGLKENNVKG